MYVFVLKNQSTQSLEANLVQCVMPIIEISDRFKNTHWLITQREIEGLFVCVRVLVWVRERERERTIERLCMKQSKLSDPEQSVTEL